MEESKNTTALNQATQTAKKDLELAYYQIKEALSFPNEPWKQVLADDLITMLEQFKTDLLKESEPKNIFKRAFEALNAIDKKIFVLGYILDNIPQVHSIPEVLSYCKNLGLLHIKNDDIRTNGAVDGWGNLFLFIKSCYRRIGIIATKLVSSSLKSIPELAKFEHKVTFGKNGLLPEISFSTGSDIELTLETILDEVGDTLWFHDLALQKTLSESGTNKSEKG